MKNTLLLPLLLFNLVFAQQYFPSGLVPYEVEFFGAERSCDNLFVGQINQQNYPALLLLDENAEIQWYYVFSYWGFPGDFKVHEGGLMSYRDANRFLVMDSNFRHVDTVFCVNSTFDQHDLLVTPDNHYFIICREYENEDLSALTTTQNVPGSANASVMYNLVEELDPNKNLESAWYGQPWYSADSSDLSFFDAPNYIEPMHSNAIDLDDNGNLLLTNRHYNEVISVNWATGNVNWRLGGPANDFTFLNDNGFFGPHDARFLPGNRISLFDNGAQHTPPIPRAVIYQLDTLNMTAELVWEYEKTSPDTSKRMGSFRVLPDGDGIIGWGDGDPQPFSDISYVKADSTPVMDIELGANSVTYRALCGDLPFTFRRPRILCDETGTFPALTVEGTYSGYEWSNGATTQSITLTDTGYYQVFVPYGIGYAGSRSVHITDLGNPCAAVGIAPELEAGEERELIGIWDLLGREVSDPRPGVLYVFRYSDGSLEKVVRW